MITKTEKEIFQQHIALKKTYNYMIDHREETEQFFQKCATKKLVFIGCGSSYMLAKSGEKMFASAEGFRTSAIAGGDYLMNPSFYRESVKGSLVVALSRSGKTTEMVRALSILKKQEDCPILSLTAAQPNDFMEHADLNLTMEWCYDQSVCQTRTVSNLYLALMILYSFWNQDSRSLEALKTAVEENERFQLRNRACLKRIAGMDWERAVILANGPFAGIAEEGALAFTEIAMIPGEYHPILDYRHGPIVLNDEKTLNIILLDQAEDNLQKGLIKDLKEYGGVILAIGQGTKEFWEADRVIDIGDAEGTCAAGIPFINTIQILAYEKSVILGRNPDEPTGLDAYILL